MNTELDLVSLLIIRRGLKHYNAYLDLNLKEDNDRDKDDIANLADEAKETQDLLQRVNVIYAFKHEQVYGEPPMQSSDNKPNDYKNVTDQDTKLSIKDDLLILRGFEHYKTHLFSEIERLNDEQDDVDDDSDRYDEIEDEIADLVDDADKASNVIRFVDEIYSYKYEQEYGEPPIPVRKT